FRFTADKHDRFCVPNFLMSTERSAQITKERREIVIIRNGEINSFQGLFSKTAESKDRFIRQTRTRYYACFRTVFLQLIRHHRYRLVPGRRNEFPAFLVADQRCLYAIRMIYKSVRKASLHVQ